MHACLTSSSLAGVLPTAISSFGIVRQIIHCCLHQRWSISYRQMPSDLFSSSLASHALFYFSTWLRLLKHKRQIDILRFWQFNTESSYCCHRKTRAACAQSFAPWQQATIEITRRDHSIIACSRQFYLNKTGYSVVIMCVITLLYKTICNLLLNTDIGYKETKEDVKFEKFQSTLARHPGIERNNAHSE